MRFGRGQFQYVVVFKYYVVFLFHAIDNLLAQSVRVFLCVGDNVLPDFRRINVDKPFYCSETNRSILFPLQILQLKEVE